MHKLVNLERADITHLYDALEHFSDQVPVLESERMKIICDYLRPLKSSDNIKWTLWCEQKMPQTADNTLNYITSQLAILEDSVECGHDDQAWVFMENQFWQYLSNNYDFDLEEHNLDKHSSHEAQVYAILHIAAKEPNFYDEGVAFE